MAKFIINFQTDYTASVVRRKTEHFDFMKAPFLSMLVSVRH